VIEELMTKIKEDSTCEASASFETINVGYMHDSMNKSIANAIKETIDLVKTVLCALKITKYVVVMFNPDADDAPYHTEIVISKELKKEWGNEKLNGFLTNFYENVKKEFADEMTNPLNKKIDAELVAVGITIHYMADSYDFDAYFSIAYNPSLRSIDAYRWAWIMVKKS
jgi:hypothetical protein